MPVERKTYKYFVSREAVFQKLHDYLMRTFIDSEEPAREQIVSEFLFQNESVVEQDQLLSIAEDLMDVVSRHGTSRRRFHLVERTEEDPNDFVAEDEPVPEEKPVEQRPKATKRANTAKKRASKPD